MKNLSFLFAITLSFNVFAGELETAIKAIQKIVPEGRSHGKTAEGYSCFVESYQGYLTIISKLPGCSTINYEENNSNRNACMSQFLVYFNENIKKSFIKKDYILLEVKSKDSEGYSSSITSKVEVKVADKINVTVSSNKGLVGYGNVLDCSI